MKMARGLEELNGAHVDCYISTDVEEALSRIFEPLGFYEVKNTNNQLCAEHDDFGGYSLLQPRTGLLIEGIDVDIYIPPAGPWYRLEEPETKKAEDAARKIFLEQARRWQHDIGFVPMSQFRIYASGESLVPILKQLIEDRQHAAFYNEAYTVAFVKLVP